MPETRKYRLHSGQSGSAITVRVTPRSKHNEIKSVMGDGTVKVALNAPVIGGEANQALIQFLSGVLGVPQNRLEIVAGSSGADKLISILDLDAHAVQERILAHID
ncbi:MAG: DUF167 domain-containing protein [Chloroflexi bacterium]|jgi:uncharacterized protein (TIGR00251 family)|nr:DUF167 domain-containing protein [Anaerolineaceae bacterium]NMB88808.1 DUF167 domain-containing protein [Chloroflexota bacterium]